MMSSISCSLYRSRRLNSLMLTNCPSILSKENPWESAQLAMGSWWPFLPITSGAQRYRCSDFLLASRNFSKILVKAGMSMETTGLPFFGLYWVPMRANSKRRY